MESLPSKALILLAMLAGMAPSQVQWHLGGGSNFSRTDAEDRTEEGVGLNFSNRSGFNVGAGLEVFPNPYFSMCQGLSLETRGVHFQITSSSSRLYFNSEERLLYLQLPMLARLHLPVKRSSLYVFTGPELGFLLWDEAATLTNVFGPLV